MIAREHTAVRNVGLLLMLRGLLVVGGVVVAAVVPRLLGPTGYGQVALLVSLSFLFTLAASLGFTQVMGRHVPGFCQSSEEDGLRSLFGGLLAIGLVALSLTSVANLSPLTHDRPGVALAAALLRLGTFWVLGLSLVGRWGSWGASLALLIEFLPSPSLLRGSSAFSLLGQIRRVSSLGARRGRASSRRADSVRISISSASRAGRPGRAGWVLHLAHATGGRVFVAPMGSRGGIGSALPAPRAVAIVAPSRRRPVRGLRGGLWRTAVFASAGHPG
jgi:hypothetical protein